MCLCLGQSYIFDYGFMSNPGIRWRIYVAIKIELFHTQSTLTPVNLWPFPIESPWPWPIITFHLLKTQLYMDCEYYHCTDTDIQRERDVCKIYDVHLSCCNWNFQKNKRKIRIYWWLVGWLVCRWVYRRCWVCRCSFYSLIHCSYSFVHTLNSIRMENFYFLFHYD